MASTVIAASAKLDDAEDKLSEAAIKRSEADRVAELAAAAKDERSGD